uniref:U-box domain-containing protein n=1 Tax=Aureoumbra lagunensis TaxID=44058 RepID=A0A7S3JS04_9STRA|mmetsp:Transcript_17495/g.22804  ORF Transcript_17495/g.22804 Transcript_17495/m.22804 type:complete len:665 (-) Transcript_17495:413-2407(-)|eukprot:CAMPEP_0197289804 /NCGR_PEP_ID=MMETSP0890-20130614/7071_1 /TAXON_ID=44058 ORGANISM="Aureoumbra lagunensis, Strain CCMP1510" /NCGR_SAMPLE_ID=MMETSP0890 /ASSEMBLY_ACC=CAM_ASM_000533 /LENGTH=664 /DNA_ID=CAMNT_0042761439 /DNA_START=45 /DNA_END=2039 /DNA_ORIENTATION=-
MIEEEISETIERVWLEVEKEVVETKGPLESEAYRVKMCIEVMGKCCQRSGIELDTIGYQYDENENYSASTRSVKQLRDIVLELGKFVEICAHEKVKSLLRARKLTQKVIALVCEMEYISEILSSDIHTSKEFRAGLRQARRELAEIRSFMHQVDLPDKINRAIRLASIEVLIQSLIDLNVAQNKDDAENQLACFSFVIKMNKQQLETIPTVGSLFSKETIKGIHALDQPQTPYDDGKSEEGNSSVSEETQLHETAVYKLCSSKFETQQTNKQPYQSINSVSSGSIVSQLHDGPTGTIIRSEVVNDIVEELVASGAEESAAQAQMDKLCAKLMARANAKAATAASLTTSSEDEQTLSIESENDLVDEVGSSVSAVLMRRRRQEENKEEEEYRRKERKKAQNKEQYSLFQNKNMRTSSTSLINRQSTASTFHNDRRQVPDTSSRPITPSIPKKTLAETHSAPISSHFIASSRKNKDKGPPPLFICPLTRVVMTDPVQLFIGNEAGLSYERAAIQDWIKTHPHQDPITRRYHEKSLHLETNIELAQIIQKWRQSQEQLPQRKSYGFLRIRNSSTKKKKALFQHRASFPRRGDITPPPPILRQSSSKSRKRIPSLRTWTRSAQKSEQRNLKSYLSAITSAPGDINVDGDGDEDEYHRGDDSFQLLYYH